MPRPFLGQTIFYLEAFDTVRNVSTLYWLMGQGNGIDIVGSQPA